MLLVGTPLPIEQAADLAAVVGDGGRGMGLVTDHPMATSRWHLSRESGCHWRLDPLGLLLEPLRLDADEMADLGALLQDARADSVPAVLAPVVAGRADDEPFVERPWAIQVRVMGSVDAIDGDGKEASFERAKALELLVWLAQHRTSASRMGARTAMWQTDVRDATFNNVVSDARRALARLVEAPDGEEWIGRTNSDRIPLHRDVVTDAELIDARRQHARRCSDPVAIEVLRDALDMVRDVPYSGSAYLWPEGEGLASNLVVSAIGVATDLAQRCLAVGDLDGVFAATAHGLRVLPGHDELVCLRMQAHGANGDRAGVRQEYETYERLVVNDPWGDATPSAKVVEWRNRLLRGEP